VDGAYSNKHEAVDHGGEIVELRDIDVDILEQFKMDIERSCDEDR
jgi:hypothetical protein